VILKIEMGKMVKSGALGKNDVTKQEFCNEKKNYSRGILSEVEG